MYRIIISVLLSVFVSTITVGFSATAQTIKTTARSAYIMDLSTGSVLLSKNADLALPPASMSKLMTIYIVFELIKNRSLSLKDKFIVSKKAWRKGGSKMFVKIGDQVTISDLLRGIIIQSGNDACIVIAEGISGSEKAFAILMTQKAQELGLVNSTFSNATGWPHPKQLMSARDLGTLSTLMIKKFPQLYKIFAEKTFRYNQIKQGNRNPLLYRNIGADGLKTGHTKAAGYGLTASAIRNGRRIILVLNGMKSVRQRSVESLRLMEWAFRAFMPITLFKKSEEVTQADVWLGNTAKVPLMVSDDIKITLPVATANKLKATVIMENPVAAPIKKGEKLATLKITAPGIQTKEVELVAGREVRQLGFIGRLGAAIKHVLWGPS
ncbi:MAG: D-alanyl-D-alanine carboxypeptidase family protein [Pseudomonadota bacterium]|nr:D-alanyl-D-alanine carboxypeptidase family protein [Pseudomonadota bacterium]